MAKIHDDSTNQVIADDINHLINIIGDIHLHISGEGKVDFLGGVVLLADGPV